MSHNALLNLDTIKKNWKYIPMELIFTFVNGEYDGDSSDSLIQYLLYKEVLFG